MTTITMTWKELKAAIKLCTVKCDWSPYSDNCKPGVCPIWRRAEKRLERENKKYNIIQPWHRKAKPMVFGPVPTVVDGKLKPGKLVVCSICGKPREHDKHILYGNDQDNPVKHEFTPLERDYANVTKRNGDPIVVDGKIVRLPKKRTCGNCFYSAGPARGSLEVCRNRSQWKKDTRRG